MFTTGGNTVSDVVARMRRHRVAFAIAFDIGAWLIGYAVFAWLRLDSDASAVPWQEVMTVGVATAAAYVLLALPFRLHQGRARTASLEEAVLLGMLMGGTGFGVFVLNLIAQWIPRSIPAGAILGALVIAAWGRATWRTPAPPPTDASTPSPTTSPRGSRDVARVMW